MTDPLRAIPGTTPWRNRTLNAVWKRGQRIRWEALMLGDKLGTESGKVTGQRVLPNPGGGPKMETSVQATGTLLGVNEVNRGTYSAAMRSDGTLYGEGQGLVMGQGGEMATWVGQGVVTIRKDGSVSYRGALYYQSPSAAWSRLNGAVAVFEYEVDTQGNTRYEAWEWK